MRQFINGGTSAFNDLEQRARHTCVVFQEEMPPGVSPSRARVGFEINPENDNALLLVDRSAEITGVSPSVHEWLQNGEKTFPNFAALQRWIHDELAPCYSCGTSNVVPIQNGSVLARRQTQNGNRDLLRPEELTDLNEVLENSPNEDQPSYLDANSLFQELSSLVRGQDDALQTLSKRVCSHLARKNPRRPLTMFFVGPTGVGKTKTAETLAIMLGKSEEGRNSRSFGYLRLDMAEYSESHRVSQLFGAPQGYVGHDSGAQLPDALAANPRTVVLLDEIEKAHPHVVQSLMNCWDAGRLSTAMRTERGREIDCRQAIFLCTSNLKSEFIVNELNDSNAFNDTRMVDKVCRSRLKEAGIAPELVGRITSFLVFKSLSSKTRAEVLTLAIASVAAEYGVRVGYIEPLVIVSILKQAGDNTFGARPDEYLVDELLGEAFAQAAANCHNDRVAVCGGPPFECRSLVSTC